MVGWKRRSKTTTTTKQIKETGRKFNRKISFIFLFFSFIFFLIVEFCFLVAARDDSDRRYPSYKNPTTTKKFYIKKEKKKKVKPIMKREKSGGNETKCGVID